MLNIKLKFDMQKINLTILFILMSWNLFSQGFLHVSGKNIVNRNNENFIIRSIGTGNWMVQEGYMMQTSDVAGTQHEFKAKLTATIGAEKTNQFYQAWLNNHFTKADVDSMGKWGFNAIRVAMHYKWFTLPIEEEPVAGENTWHESGFVMIDNLLDWCEANQMYLILDLHAAPGGQGKDQAISDYDPTKPSLWENNYNKTKTVALWKKLAERYANEPWIGGYDLINEINWTFPEGNNSQIRALYGQISNAIRTHDTNHILFVEGNWFANDFSGLTPPWDANMAYSFHKYWTYNDESSIKWMLDLRNAQNRPVWLGETGENSNTWFTSLVSLVEKNNIGWSWWPVKKSGINNVMYVKTNKEYTDLIETWKGNGTMTADAAFNAVMAFSENHKVENCEMRYDVIDALIRQPKTSLTKPFKHHTTGQTIYFTNYDLGRNNFAYFDKDTANYHLNTNTFVNWNKGWAYRNDGVDIETCKDSQNNGYSVGWTEVGEWLQYTINSAQVGAYQLQIRTASEQTAVIHLEVDGKVASKPLTITGSGGWATWKTTTFDGIILPQGETKVRIVFDSGTANLNYFSLSNPQSVDNVKFEIISAETDKMNNTLFLRFNKEITNSESELNLSDFQVIVNSSLATVSEIKFEEGDKQCLVFSVNKDLFYSSQIKINYVGSSLKNNQQSLTQFSAFTVINKLIKHSEIPGKIEAENFYTNVGFELSDCTDAGGGKNTSYASVGDYLEYFVNVSKDGNYEIDFRVAALSGTPEIIISNTVNGVTTEKAQKRFTATGGWQTWNTQSAIVALPAGKSILKIQAKSGEFNLNWLEVNLTTGIYSIKKKTINLFPNPTSDVVNLQFENEAKKDISIYSLEGSKVFQLSTNNLNETIDLRFLDSGFYLIEVRENNQIFRNKINFTKR